MSLEQFTQSAFNSGEKPWMYINAQEIKSALPIISSANFGSLYANDAAIVPISNGQAPYDFNALFGYPYASPPVPVSFASFENGITFLNPIPDSGGTGIQVETAGYYRVNVSCNVIIPAFTGPATGKCSISINQVGLGNQYTSVIYGSNLAGQASLSLALSGIVHLSLTDILSLAYFNNLLDSSSANIPVVFANPTISLNQIDLVTPFM